MNILIMILLIYLFWGFQIIFTFYKGSYGCWDIEGGTPPDGFMVYVCKDAP